MLHRTGWRWRRGTTSDGLTLPSNELSHTALKCSSQSVKLVQRQPGAVETFRPAFASLVGLIQGRVRYPDTWREMDREERQDFKASRHAIGDTLIHAAGACCAPLRAEALALGCQRLAEAADEAESCCRLQGGELCQGHPALVGCAACRCSACAMG